MRLTLLSLRSSTRAVLMAMTLGCTLAGCGADVVTTTAAQAKLQAAQAEQAKAQAEHIKKSLEAAQQQAETQRQQIDQP